MPKYNLFKKMIVWIVIMLLPIVGFYAYANHTSTDVIGSELNQSNTNQLIFFQNQVNTQIDMLAVWPNLLLQDPDISGFKDIFKDQTYLDLTTINLVKRVQTKLRIQESSSNWRSSLLIYSPVLGRVVSSSDLWKMEPGELGVSLQPGWRVERVAGEHGDQFQFTWRTAYPYSAFLDPSNANIIIEVRFDSRNIVDMLDRFKNDGRGDPFYYHPHEGRIHNRTADRDVADLLIEQIEQDDHSLPTESRTLSVNGEQYLVNLVQSSTTGWYLIDYIPLKEVLRPIDQMNRFFYVFMALILLVSSGAAYLLYAEVQVPIKRLVQSFQRLKNGDYSTRLMRRGNNEFSYVYERFNLMVEQIQDLFQRVYLEKLHVKEARLKQLQSQINPHFFYNCFSFISSMAKLGNTDAVVSMSQQLSKYYRYTTRQERDMVPISEELDFVISYLAIQKMRMKRLEYRLELPNELKELEVPPLLIQPIVENAVLHGVEPISAASTIQIRVYWAGAWVHVEVEDDGRGMEEEEMLALQRKLGSPMDEEMGCGVWNVHQRSQLRFGQGAGLTFSRSVLGGLQVRISWKPPEAELLRMEGRTR